MKGYIWRPPLDLKEELQEKASEIGIPLSNLLIVICRKYLKERK